MFKLYIFFKNLGLLGAQTVNWKGLGQEMNIFLKAYYVKRYFLQYLRFFSILPSLLLKNNNISQSFNFLLRNYLFSVTLFRDPTAAYFKQSYTDVEHFSFHPMRDRQSQTITEEGIMRRVLISISRINKSFHRSKKSLFLTGIAESYSKNDRPPAHSVRWLFCYVNL